MTQEKQDYMIRSSAGLVPGLIVAGLGVLFLLDNLNVVRIYNWWQLWPTIVIAIGATRLVDSPSHGEKASGAVMIVIGGLFLAMTFGWLSWDVWKLWPVALIGLGIVLLFQRLEQLSGRAQPNRASSRFTSAAATDGTAFFGAVNRRIVGEFPGGDYASLFGGCDIDLRQAEIPPEGAVVNVTAIFGGVTLKVPENCFVVSEITAIFGGDDDKTRQPSPDAPGVRRLTVRGAAICGGVEIKN